jgi:hypothetical protein
MNAPLSFDSLRAQTGELLRGDGRSLLAPCFVAWAFSTVADVVLRLADRLPAGPDGGASFLAAFVTIGVNLANALVHYGLFLCALRLVLGLEVNAGTLLLAFRDSFRGILAMIGIAIVTFAFWMLLVVPGVAAYVMLYPTLFLLAGNRNLGIFEAYGKSMALTQGSRWSLFRLLLLYQGPSLALTLAVVAVSVNWNGGQSAPVAAFAEAVLSLVLSLTLLPRQMIATALYFRAATAAANIPAAEAPVWEEPRELE